MKIRVIGCKADIDNFLRFISKITPYFSASQLYPSRYDGSSYRCYIEMNSKYLKNGKPTADRAGG